MFAGSAFNQDISKWDVSSVKSMAFMFYDCKTFNQDISRWNVSNVENMSSMFNSAGSFDQDLSGWDVSNVSYMHILDVFKNCPCPKERQPKFK